MRIRDLFAQAVARRDVVVLFALAAASALRLAYVTYLGDDIGGPDGDTYDQAAWDLVQDGWDSPQVTGQPYFPPGYPMLVALHYSLVGRHPFAVKLSQVIIIAVATWVTYRLAESIAGPQVGLVAGVGMSVSPVWLALAHPLMYEAWQALLLVVCVFLLVRATERRSTAAVVAAGLAIGLAAVLQDKFLTLVPLLAVWIAVYPLERRARWSSAAVFVVTAALVVAPFVARNVAIYGEPLVLASNHGINVVIGNHPGADGGYEPSPTFPDECTHTVEAAGSSYERDRALWACGLRYMLATPAETILLVPAKLVRFWAPFAGPSFETVNWRHYFDPRLLAPDGIRDEAWYGAFELVSSWILAIISVGLFAVGALRALRMERFRRTILMLLPVVWLILVHALTFGDPRFRVPVLPLVLIFQSVALVGILRRIGVVGETPS